MSLRGLPSKDLQEELFQISFIALNQTFYLHLEGRNNVFNSTIIDDLPRGISNMVDRVKTFHCRLLTEDQANDIYDRGVQSIYYKDVEQDIGWGKLTFFNLQLENLSSNTLDNWEIDGLFLSYNETYHIIPTRKYLKYKNVDENVLEIDKKYVLYKDSDRNLHYTEMSCDIVNAVNNSEINLFERDDSFGLPSCPQTRKVLNVVAVADCTYILYHGGIQNSFIQILNSIAITRYTNFLYFSLIYEKEMNLTINLAFFKFEEVCQPDSFVGSWGRRCLPDYSIYNRLGDFSRWRGQFVSDRTPLWILFSEC
jgi:hypothetical protein